MNPDSADRALRILIFTHGTVVMHGTGVSVSRAERVRQVKEHQYAGHEEICYSRRFHVQ